MKILQTPIRFYPYVGGVENHVYYLSKELLKQGNSVKVICANEPLSDLRKINGIGIKRLNYLGKITNTNICLSLPKEILKEDFDVIHTHMPTPWSSDWSILISKLKGKKSIITIHNDMDKPGFFKKIITEIYLNTIFRLSLYLANKIIIVNPEWKNSFKNTRWILECYNKKIVAIPNGVDINLFKKSNKNHKKYDILFVSILDKYHEFKGFDYLMNSLKTIKKEYPKVKLLVIGEGELKGEYYKKAKFEEIESNVEFIGKKDQDELPKYYSNSSIFVLPSIDIEGFGIVAIEAMACKTPVIVTNIIGVAKEIKERNCGIVVPPKDPKALAEAIIKLLKNPKLAKQMGENGRRLVKEKYDWKKVAREIEKVYKEVLKK